MASRKPPPTPKHVNSRDSRTQTYTSYDTRALVLRVYQFRHIPSCATLYHYILRSLWKKP